MKTYRFTKTRKNSTLKTQRGDFLLESLIGLVLMSILGMGTVYVTSQVSRSHRDMQMQEITVRQLRAALIMNGTGAIDICTTTPTVNLPTQESVTVQVQGCNTATTAVVNGTTVSGVPRPLYIMAYAPSVGEIVVGGNWVEVPQ